MLKEIHFKTIPHKKQRYPTAGDYFKDKKGRFQFRVSDMRNSDYEFLVLIHELVEWYMVKRVGIPMHEIDRFDIEFEKKRKKGNNEEPGDDPRAPYYFAHQFASMIEESVASKLGVNWEFYTKRVGSLYA